MKLHIFTVHVSFYKIGREAQAGADFRVAINLNPQNAMAYEHRGLMYLEDGNVIDAIEDFNKAVDLSPTADNFYRRAMAHATNENRRMACDDLKKAVELGHETAKELIEEYCR